MNRRAFLAVAAAAPFALRAGLASAVNRPQALVTCDFEARLALVDLSANLAAGWVLKHVSTAPGPRSIERVGAFAVVAHWDVGVLSVVHRSSVHIRHELGGFDQPRYTAAHPDGRHAFVTESGTSVVTAVDVVAGKRLGSTAHLGEWARHVTIDGAGTTIWTALGSASDRVAIVDVTDPRRPRHVRTIAPGFRVHDVAFAPGGKQVWVTSGDAGRAAVFERDGTLVRSLRADAAPQHVTFGPGVAYVTSGDSGTCHVQSLADGRVLRTTAVPAGSYNVQSGTDGLVITPSLLHGTLTVLDPRGALRARIPVASSCHDACFV